MSSKKKGLSFEEKRKRLGDLFLEKKDFFQLKELEKLAPKIKGIVAQSVKEVLQSLVDDRLVISEKIGTSNYFWSFPSTAVASRRNVIENLKTEIAEYEKSNEELSAAIQQASSGREESEERIEAMKEYLALQTKNNAIISELDKYRELDPDVFEAKKIDCEKLKESINRFTDNIFSLQTYCSDKFLISKADFEKQFEIPEDFDYVQ